ncbi:MAG TPA: amidohydrolase [Pseudoalteromonas sp.]|nr:amidohydrolase [Pseudoalteromonas sp.]
MSISMYAFKKIKKSLLLIACALTSFTSYAVDEQFVRYQAGRYAIKNITLIDGTGKPAQTNQTVVINKNKIVNIGATAEVGVAKGVNIIDGSGKTLIPGLVMMHEHMFYPTGKAHYTEMLYSFPRLYLAGGATTIRTAGTTAPYADLKLRDDINAGKSLGPDIDVTAPYLNGPGLPILKIKSLRDADDAKKMMDYWGLEGVTSYKAYMHINQNELDVVIKKAHEQNNKVTAHLCSVTYREAAALGIDNLEHGFFAATDFVKNKQKDVCPSNKDVQQSFVELDINSPEVTSLINYLVAKNVVLTSTLTVFETFTKGRPKAYPKALDALIPQVRDQYESRFEKIAKQSESSWPLVFKKMMQLEKMFVAAGGKLMVGTDPTGYGGVIAGFSNQRAIELLVETGFMQPQAIKIATLNAAQYLNKQNTIGSIEVGKHADLVIVNGDFAKDASAIRNMETVFKNGVGYNSTALFDNTKSVVGLH